MYFTQLNTTILSCRSVPVSQMSVCYFLLLDLEQMSDRSFSLSQMKYFWRGAGRRKFKGKAEGWWRLARFFLIVRSQTSLASFAVPSATREPWRWKGSRQIGPWQIGPSHVNPDKLSPICQEPVTWWKWPVVPEEEPLAGFFNVLLSASRQDLAHFCLHLAQVHLNWSHWCGRFRVGCCSPGCLPPDIPSATGWTCRHLRKGKVRFRLVLLPFLDNYGRGYYGC